MEKIISIPLINNQVEVKKFSNKHALIKSSITLAVILFIYSIVIIGCSFIIPDFNFIKDSNIGLVLFLILAWTGFIYYQTYKKCSIAVKYIRKIELRAKRLIITANSNIEYEYSNIICLVNKKDHFIIKCKNADHLIPMCTIGMNNYKIIEDKFKCHNR